MAGKSNLTTLAAKSKTANDWQALHRDSPIILRCTFPHFFNLRQNNREDKDEGTELPSGDDASSLSARSQ